MAPSGMRALAHRWLVKSTVKPWATKSVEFWTLLSYALLVVRPRVLVELGSGRSTSYLTEYAMKTGAAFASIEQNRAYAARIRRGLRHSFLTDRYLHHVPVAADGWYDADRLGRATPRGCDCLFVDGPVGIAEALGPGTRQSARSLDWFGTAAAGCRLLIVDDVHRASVWRLFEELLGKTRGLERVYLEYPVQPHAPNVVALAMPDSARAAVVAAAAPAGIGVFHDYDVSRCTEP